MKQRSKSLFLLELFALISFCVLQGCALFGGSGESVKRAKGYTVNPPTGWIKAETNGESDYAYKLPSGNLVTLNSSCQRNSNAPLEILTKHLLFGARNVAFEKRERFMVSEAEGLYSSARASLDGKPFRLELFVLPKNACIFDFSLLSPKTLSEQEKAEFIQFFKSFTYGTN